jgi:hypothetical protein
MNVRVAVPAVSQWCPSGVNHPHLLEELVLISAGPEVSCPSALLTPLFRCRASLFPVCGTRFGTDDHPRKPHCIVTGKT